MIKYTGNEPQHKDRVDAWLTACRRQRPRNVRVLRVRPCACVQRGAFASPRGQLLIRRLYSRRALAPQSHPCAPFLSRPLSVVRDAPDTA